MKRKYKAGQNRNQGMLLPASIDDYVGEDSVVRIIDLFVEKLDLEEMGFRNTADRIQPGQPAYPPRALLKLYLYGYLNQVRSSRRLERETKRNLEVIWLMENLKPGYKTIANFRKENGGAIKRVNQKFLEMIKEMELLGKELVGIDGSHFRGNVGKRSIKTKGKLEKAIKHYEQEIERYYRELDQMDEEEKDLDDEKEKEKIKRALEELKGKKEEKEKEQAEMEEKGVTQIAAVDKDARLLTKNGNRVAGYNVQIAVDGKHKLIVVGKVTQERNDQRLLTEMALEAKRVLGVERLTALADSGYYSGWELKKSIENKIDVYMPETRSGKTQKRKYYTKDQFEYVEAENYYLCPNGRRLNERKPLMKNGREMRQYITTRKQCEGCPLRKECINERKGYRRIERWRGEELVIQHRKKMANEGGELMRKRAGMVEHPFGTLKQWCGWTHFLVRGLEKVQSEMSLLTLCYNFKRVINILGNQQFKKYCLQML